jgi:Alpha-L-arabinofuranosidase B, catalytic
VARNSRTRRLIRWCFRALIMVTSLAVVVGLAATAPPARAATAGPSSALSHSARAAGTGLGASVTTQASGDVVVDLDFGQSLDPTATQNLINFYQGQNSHLSDTIERVMDEYDVAPALGSALGITVPDTTTDWQAFDGTVTLDSDGTGLSLTLPASEAGTTAITFWQAFWANALGFLATVGIQVLCDLAAPEFHPLCSFVAGFMGAFIADWVKLAIDGQSLTDPANLGPTLADAIWAGIAGSLLEGIFSFCETTLITILKNIGGWITKQAKTAWTFLGFSSYLATFGQVLTNSAPYVEIELHNLGSGARHASAGSLPCDVYAYNGTPCTATYSMDRALYTYYNGPLYQVKRASDSTTKDIGLLSVGGDVNASEQDSFCAGTTCIITKIYDQSPEWNDLTIEQGGGANHNPDQGAVANALPIKIGVGANQTEAYGLDIEQGTGYRDDTTRGIATNGQPEGMYMVASGTHVNSGCCFDFGNVETTNNDDNAGRMDAVNLTTWCGGNSSPCAGDGPWVEADLENGQWMGNGPNPGDTGNSSDYVTAMLKNDGQSTFELQGGDSTSGGLTKWYDGALPSQYQPMHQEGAIVLGTGGDNSNSDIGSFFEGVMTQGFPSDAADAAVQAGIVAAGYNGSTNPAGFTSPVSSAPASAAGQAVVHQGYSSVFTVDSSNGHLRETYLPKMYDSWLTHDLSSTAPTMPDTPPVMAGTQPVAVVHCGYTSVYTVDASSGDLQETYLPALGQSWSTQDLSAKYQAPPTNVTPTVVEHAAGAPGGSAACGYTSVYTRDRSGDLQETYLPNTGFPGDSWITQDLSAKYQAPQVQPGTSPVAIVHCGYTSVYTVDAAGHHLQETYLSAIGQAWKTQDLTVKYNAPPTATTPTAVMHSAGAPGGSAGCGYTSVYTVDEGSQDLQETYLPVAGFPGDPWISQDLSANYQAPTVAPGTQPQALVHMGYTSLYTVDQGSQHVQETYLTAIGQAWNTQDLTAKYKAPVTDQSPIVLLHPDASGNLDWTSVYTVDEFSNDLDETYLPNTGFPGDSWVTQDLTAKYTAPPVAVQNSSNQASWSVAHGGYTSTYTVDSGGDLQETYLPKMYGTWSTQDLSAKYQAPRVNVYTRPVALVHDGYTSVYTVDAGDASHATDDLQETYLAAVGGNWVTQDLSKMAGTPPVASGSSPTAVLHDGYTSVYTVAANGDLWETYLPALGGPWYSQDLSSKYQTPKVLAYTSPVAIYHDGYTSVYTVDVGDPNLAGGDLQETYLPAMGGGWVTQDLSQKYGTPEVEAGTSPTVVFHDGYVSVYSADASWPVNSYGDLQETYLPAIGDNWVTQDLTNNDNVPGVIYGATPMALYHTGFTSVYFSDWSTGGLDEAYLPAISDVWGWNGLSKTPGTPTPNEYLISPLLHYAPSGGLTWTSVFTIDSGSNDLQETYLPAIGGSWTTQNLSAENPPGTPPW